MKYLREQIIELAKILEKLLKVTRHSDPSATQKKKDIYGKNQQKLQLITKKTFGENKPTTLVGLTFQKKF